MASDPAPVLVVGYGSDLRGDDAAGRRVAEAVAELSLQGVEVRSLHQLGPEIVEDFAGRRLVVLVDAAADARAPAVETVVASTPTGAVTHVLEPGALLSLAVRLGWAPQQLVVVRVPASDLSLGADLSPCTRDAVVDATGQVVALCAGTV